MKGVYVTNNPIDVDDYTFLDLTEAQITLANDVNDDIIYMDDDNITIYGGYLYGNKANKTAGDGIHTVDSQHVWI